MTERDIDKNPYSPDEARVAKWFCDRGIGGGDDPIGALIALHEYAMSEIKDIRERCAVKAEMVPINTFTTESHIKQVAEARRVIAAAIRE